MSADRSAEAPFDGPRPTVAECIEAGGHFWPEGHRARSAPCTRCGWDPGWIGEGTTEGDDIGKQETKVMSRMKVMSRIIAKVVSFR